MKKISLFSTVIAMVAFTSCEQGDALTSDEITNIESVASLDLASEEAMASGFEDLDLISEAGMDLLDIDLNTNGRGDQGKKRGRKRNRIDYSLECAVVDKDTVNQVITIDFGDGCESPNGTVRKGKIIIEYTGDRHTAGSYRMVTLVDFYVDSLHLEGIRRTEVVSSDSLSRVVKTTLTNGQVTFPDETFATRTAEHTKSMFQGDDESDDYTIVTGGASGLKVDGSEYSITILEDLLIKRSCNGAHIVIPVSGVKEIVNAESTATMDYGDGTCDNEVDITIDGVTTTKTIEPKGRGSRRKG
ncbi:MAG: hypothetical protein ACJA08_002676 [Cyclobacteriaceae bacterium]|jgi:hypothetical protein